MHRARLGALAAAALFLSGCTAALGGAALNAITPNPQPERIEVPVRVPCVEKMPMAEDGKPLRCPDWPLPSASALEEGREFLPDREERFAIGRSAHTQCKEGFGVLYRALSRCTRQAIERLK